MKTKSDETKVTINDAAVMLGCTTKTILNAIKRGALTPVRDNIYMRTYWVTRDSINAALARCAPCSIYNRESKGVKLLASVEKVIRGAIALDPSITKEQAQAAIDVLSGRTNVGVATSRTIGRVLSRKECAVILNCCPQHVSRLASEGILKKVAYGKRAAGYTEESVRRYANGEESMNDIEKSVERHICILDKQLDLDFSKIYFFDQFFVCFDMARIYDALTTIDIRRQEITGIRIKWEMLFKKFERKALPNASNLLIYFIKKINEIAKKKNNYFDKIITIKEGLKNEQVDISKSVGSRGADV